MRNRHSAPMRLGASLLFATLWSVSADAEGAYLFDILKAPTFHKAYVTLMAREKHLPSWLHEITSKGNFVATPETDLSIGGIDYRLFHACKAHDCAGHELEVMFSADGSRAFALLIDSGKPPRWLGHPDPQQQAALRKAMQHD